MQEYPDSPDAFDSGSSDLETEINVKKSYESEKKRPSPGKCDTSPKEKKQRTTEKENHENISSTEAEEVSTMAISCYLQPSIWHGLEEKVVQAENDKKKKLDQSWVSKHVVKQQAPKTTPKKTMLDYFPSKNAPHTGKETTQTKQQPEKLVRLVPKASLKPTNSKPPPKAQVESDYDVIAIDEFPSKKKGFPSKQEKQSTFAYLEEENLTHISTKPKKKNLKQEVKPSGIK